MGTGKAVPGNVAIPSLKEQRFIAEYLKDQNGTQSAIRAGYSARSARQIAHRLLTKDDILSRILQKEKTIEAKSELTAERIHRAVLAVLEFDPRQAFNDDGTTKDISKLPTDVALALAGIEVDESQGDVKKLRFLDRIKAAELGAKLLGLTTRLEVTGKGGVPLIPTPPIDFSGIKTAELREAIELYGPGGNGEHIRS